jgi:hypothetical protein
MASHNDSNSAGTPNGQDCETPQWMRDRLQDVLNETPSTTSRKSVQEKRRGNWSKINNSPIIIGAVAVLFFGGRGVVKYLVKEDDRQYATSQQYSQQVPTPPVTPSKVGSSSVSPVVSEDVVKQELAELVAGTKTRQSMRDSNSIRIGGLMAQLDDDKHSLALSLDVFDSRGALRFDYENRTSREEYRRLNKEHIQLYVTFSNKLIQTCKQYESEFGRFDSFPTKGMFLKVKEKAVEVLDAAGELSRDVDKYVDGINASPPVKVTGKTVYFSSNRRVREFNRLQNAIKSHREKLEKLRSEL